MERVGSCNFLPKLDLAKGFYQVMLENSMEKTAFISPFGKYELVRMPFGLKNAPAVSQRIMEDALRDCSSFASGYMDDVLIFSEIWDEHINHIRRVLQALRRAGLTAKPSKCDWGRRSITYLGHILGSGQLSVPANCTSWLCKSYGRVHTTNHQNKFEIVSGCSGVLQKIY